MSKCAAAWRISLAHATLHSTVLLREQIILGQFSFRPVLNLMSRTNFPKLTGWRCKNAVLLHDKQEIHGALGWNWSDCWLWTLMSCPGASSRLVQPRRRFCSQYQQVQDKKQAQIHLTEAESKARKFSREELPRPKQRCYLKTRGTRGGILNR